MSDIKQVKVDNWGIYFLQRLKHFFNRTDYCDLTLQFQDNAQLKVHRLVLNSCTEYFEILERTCEMYSDCLVMPDDLQADVVVPIVNFMYTGQLEFKMDLLEKLYQTSLIMNMPVLTKLLDAHRVKSNLYGKRYSRNTEPRLSTPSSQPKKRTFNKSFQNDQQPPAKKKYEGSGSDNVLYGNGNYGTESSSKVIEKKNVNKNPKPTRYELPAELDDDNIFENSFSSFSYESKPLMVHPETTKYYTPKKNRIFDDPSSSKRFLSGTSTMDIVECRKITSSDIYDDVAEVSPDDSEMLTQQNVHEKKDSSQLFDQILIKDSKISIEKKDKKEKSNLDHAKIISEVLKKYPHLVKSNKNIKLKILNNPSNQKKHDTKLLKQKPEVPDYTYETDVVDSQEAARLIALGAENVKGPWICLICGTPGRAIHFTSYYNYRRHLVEVHNEKPVSNMCEYCGLKSLKRSYFVHHLYTKHGIEPPRAFNFPKCNMCNYVALTEAFLVKHKLCHSDNPKFRCAICSASFHNSNLLLKHIQKTGHKFSAEKKPNPQCIYCFKLFSRDASLYAHLKTNHYESAKNDGIIEDSDDERESKTHSDLNMDKTPTKYIEVNMPGTHDSEYDETSYNVQQRPDGKIQIVTKKTPLNLMPITKKKILNAGLNKMPTQEIKILQDVITKPDFMESSNPVKKEDNIVIIENNEYILSDPYQTDNEEIIASATSRPEYSNVANINTETSKLTLTKTNNINQPIQIVVSNEEEYKALLSSNHSIIFDDSVSDKSLTVLATPNNSSVGNTINISNAQSNEMMLYPANYPLNISAPSSTDNSNIVVVYSHPVNEQSKHYQLITSTQDIESQFIQSSAIFTQNFETVTTSAPVMSGQLVVNNASVSNSWQNDLPIATTEMQIITSEVQGDTVTQLPQIEIMQPALGVSLPQSLSNLQETVITSNNSFSNTSSGDTIEKPTNTNKALLPNTTLIPIGKLPNFTSVNETIIPPQVITDRQCDKTILIQQKTLSPEQSVSNKDHHAVENNLDDVIQQTNVIADQSNTDEKQISESILEQTDSILKHNTNCIQDPQATTFMDEKVASIKESNSILHKPQLDESLVASIGQNSNIESLQEITTITEQQNTAGLCEQAEISTLCEKQESITTSKQDETVVKIEVKDESTTDLQNETAVEQQPSNNSAECSSELIDAIIMDQQPLMTNNNQQQNPDILIENQEDTYDSQCLNVSNTLGIAVDQLNNTDVQVNDTSISGPNDIQICEIEKTLSEHDLTHKDDHLECLQTNDIEEQKQSDTFLSMEKEDIKTDDEETIENIARDIGVDPTILHAKINEVKKFDSSNKPVVKDITNLTSEWSEDEVEEESSASNTKQSEVHEDDASVITQENEPECNKNNIPQEKISSLLNDWEDNSQEEITTVGVTAIPTEVIKNTTDIICEKLDTDNNSEVEIKDEKQDDIRKLVSDWDEDVDEENTI